MRLTADMLRRIIKEEYASFGVGDKNPTRFLHGEDPHDSEGAMAMGKFNSIKKMVDELTSLLQHNDQLPGWVQDHISVAHENIKQIHGYLTNVNVSGKG
jgi:hypothetical protein